MPVEYPKPIETLAKEEKTEPQSLLKKLFTEGITVEIDKIDPEHRFGVIIFGNNEDDDSPYAYLYKTAETKELAVSDAYWENLTYQETEDSDARELSYETGIDYYAVYYEFFLAVDAEGNMLEN